MKIFITVFLLLIPIFAFGAEKVDMVLVVKSRSKLYLIRDHQILSEYGVAFGANPKGPKQQLGDQRTPEGRYILDYKKSDSAFYKSIHISYPNEEDIRRAEILGVNPGGMIMIHGQKNGFERLSWNTQQYNWTDGCIALTNRAMDEIWESVDVGTPIEIKP